MATALKVTRGDSLPLHIDVKYSDGVPYELQEGDTLIFTLKANVNLTDNPVLLQKTMTSETGPSCELLPEETELPYGMYKYDVELNIASSGRRFTIIKPTNFRVTTEVTTHE